MGNLFRLADKGAVETYYFGDEELGDDRDYIRVRSSLTKGEANEILSTAPTQERDIKGGLAFLERFFKEVVIEWSLKDEEGVPIPPTVENYRNMEAAGARLIEDKLGQHLNKLIGREVEKAEGESSS